MRTTSMAVKQIQNIQNDYIKTSYMYKEENYA